VLVAESATTDKHYFSAMTTSAPSVVVDDSMLADIRKDFLDEVSNSESVRLALFELALRKQMADGWKPPWNDRLPQTDEELRKMSTKELGSKLLATGIPAREMILYGSRPSFAMKRLEVCYRGYSELFSRPDLVDAIVGSLDVASRLSPDRSDRDNLNLAMALFSIPEMYEYPPIRDKILGHERELIDAHIDVLLNIKTFIGKNGVNRNKTAAALIAPYRLIGLSESVLSFAERVSPKETQAARASLAKFPWKANGDITEMIQYIDLSVALLKNLRQ